MKPYREGIPLHEIAAAQRVAVVDVLKTLAAAGVPLRTGALGILPTAVQQELARTIDAEFARCRSEEAMLRKYGLTSTVLNALRMTAALLRHREMYGAQEPPSGGVR